MAIAATHLTTAGNTADQTSYTTASIAPTANRLVLAWFVSVVSSGTPNIPTVTGNGLTWVMVTTRIHGARRLTLFRSMASSPSSGTVVFDLAGQTQTGAQWSIAEFSDVNTSGTNGAGAIANKAVNSATGGTSITATLTEFSDTDDAVAGGFFHVINEASTVGTSFSQIGSVNQATPDMSLITEFQAANDTTVDASWATTSANIGVAVAIRHSSSAVVPQIYATGAANGNPAAFSPVLPAGTITNDLMIMVAETNNQDITVSGWTEAPDSPQSDATDSHRITIFYKYATVDDLTDATLTSDSGDHQVAQIFGVINADTSSPFDVTAGGTDSTSDTSGSIPGDTTTVDNTLVVAVAGSGRDAVSTTEFSGWTNGDLATVTEFIDQTLGPSAGGGFGAAFGWKFTAGAYGNTTVTYANASRKGLWSGAIKPGITAGGADLSVNVSDNVTITEAKDILRDSARDVTKSDSVTVTESVTVSIFQPSLSLSVSDNITLSEGPGSGSVTDSYYFDGSDAGATDPDGVWSSDANAFDASLGTGAATTTDGSASSNFLKSEGTSAPSGTSTVTQVRARVRGADDDSSGVTLTLSAAIYTDALGELLGTPTVVTAAAYAYGSYTTLSAPSGGWTWTKVQALETKIFKSGSAKQVSADRVEIEVTATESPVAVSIISSTDLNVSVSDSITVTESVQRLVESYVNTSDSVTASEALARTLVSDVKPSDSITLTESVGRMVENYIAVSDTATITEALTLLIPELFATASDSVTITESIKVEVTSFINKSDSVTVTEAVSATIPLELSVSDSATVSEALQRLSEANVRPSDTVTITEALTTFIPELRPPLSDNVTVTESVVVTFILERAVSDSVTVSEATNVAITTDADLIVSVSDSVNVTESATTGVIFSVVVTPGIQQVGGVRIV